MRNSNHFIGGLRRGICDSEELAYATDVCEMEQSLAAAFVQSNALSKRVNRGSHSNLLTILEAIGNGLGCTVDSHRHAINPRIHNTLVQRSA